jgi:hypothetical protein
MRCVASYRLVSVVDVVVPTLLDAIGNMLRRVRVKADRVCVEHVRLLWLIVSASLAKGRGEVVVQTVAKATMEHAVATTLRLVDDFDNVGVEGEDSSVCATSVVYLAVKQCMQGKVAEALRVQELYVFKKLAVVEGHDGRWAVAATIEAAVVCDGGREVKAVVGVTMTAEQVNIVCI